MYLSIIGLDPALEPSLNRKMEDRDASEYVYREAQQAVDTVQGATKVYGRLGFDHGYNNDISLIKCMQPPIKCLRQGRWSLLWQGVGELQDKNITAFGNAVRDQIK